MRDKTSMDPGAYEQFSASVAADGEIVTQVTNYPAGGACLFTFPQLGRESKRQNRAVQCSVNGQSFGYATKESSWTLSCKTKQGGQKPCSLLVLIEHKNLTRNCN